WKPGTDTTNFPCGGTFCLQRQASNQCALFCDNGRVTVSAPGSIVCLCEGLGPAAVSIWN
ncbi:MAG: hypothetical protein JNG84_13355, partial [Archangium sp.]|nr:hypothetical protein [Archangium sp.]